MTLLEDPRWQRFNDGNYACSCCGKSFSGVFDIGFDHPDPWPHGNRQSTGQDILQVGEDVLGPDLCQIGEHRFIRCVLMLPLKGGDQKFAYGAWASVNPDNYGRYVQHDWDGTLGNFEGCFAWLMNRLPGFEMQDWLPCDLLVEDPAERPRLYVHDDAHRIAALQEEGITFDQLLDIYAAAGQDIRPHLMDG